MRLSDYLPWNISYAHPVTIGAALITIAFIKNGIWCIPNISYLNQLAIDPFSNPYQGQAQYVFTNWLGPFTAWIIGATDPWSFAVLHFAFSCFFLSNTALSLWNVLGSTEWRKSICIFFCLPVAWTHLYWIGYDSLTLALMSCVLSAIRRPWLAFAFAVGIGLQHAQQGIVAFGCLALLIGSGWWRRDLDRPALFGSIAAMGGVALGRGVLQWIIASHHILVDAGRSHFFTQHASELLGANAYGVEVFLFGILGVAWLPLIRYGQDGTHRWALYAVLAVCAAITFLTIDVTRVYAVITYPVIYFCLLQDRRWLSQISYREVAILVSVWIIVPWLYDWEGRFRTTVFPYDVAVLSHAATGWPAIPAERALWPFLPMSP